METVLVLVKCEMNEGAVKEPEDTPGIRITFKEHLPSNPGGGVCYNLCKFSDRDQYMFSLTLDD